MAEPSLQQIFGPNAVETATYFQISKADLQTYGLVPAASNKAEALKVAIDLQAKAYLTAANQANNPEQQIVMEDGFNSFVSRNNLTYLQRQITTSYQEPFTSQALNPMNY